MCRITHWSCEDLTERDIGRLRSAHKEMEKKLNQGISILRGKYRLYLKLQEINPLPFGFELKLKAHASKPIQSLIIQYTLLKKENPSFQSFFSIYAPDYARKSKKLLILNRDYPSLEWHLKGIATVHSKTRPKKWLLDLQSYISRDLSGTWFVVGFVMAFFLGIGHAFTPGHGKSLMAAYLVGHHGHVRDAIVMGLTTTFTHTFSVILLGLLIISFSHIILPSTLFPLVERISSLLIIVTGVYVLYDRIRDKRISDHDEAHHSHPHPQDHYHNHTRSHTGQAFWLAFSGGMIPCPSAMAVLFAAISIGKIGYGLLMILVFSLGLGITLVSIGIGILASRSLLLRMERARVTIGHLDLVGPVFIIIIGILFLIHGPFGSVKL